MEKIDTAISPDYVKGWTVGMGIREVIQNYVDSLDEFSCSGNIAYGKGIAKVKDNGPGIEMRHLAMGISEKKEGMIGKFGEGLKLAALILARENRMPEIWSNGKIVQAVIAYSDNFQTDTLQFILKDMEPRHAAKFKGTSVKFQCSKEELDEGKSYFSKFTTKVKGRKWIVKNAMSSPGGEIWLNGSKIGSLDSLFSYHIKDANIGNRDRTSVTEKEAEPYILKIYEKMSSISAAKEILQNVIRGGCQPWESNHLPYIELNKLTKKIWKKASNSIFGKGRYVVSSGTTSIDIQSTYRGYEVIDLGWQWNRFLERIGCLKAAHIGRAAMSRTKVIKQKDLGALKKENLDHAKILVEKYYNPTGRITIAEDLKNLAGCARSCSPSGLYDPKKERIYLRHDILDNLQQTVHTLLHECVHKHSGELDCTGEFEEALLDVAVGMMKKNEWK